jgi:hypothetical protein
MHKSATKCNETIGKWCKNKHGASKIIDTFETYQDPLLAAVDLLESNMMLVQEVLQLTRRVLMRMFFWVVAEEEGRDAGRQPQETCRGLRHP